MNYLQKFVFIVLLLTTISVTSQAVDTSKSKVLFSVSNFGLNTVKGRFTGMEGKVDINRNSLNSSMIEVCLKTNTIDTENSKRDDHLKNEDFFEVSTYPNICFNSEKIEKTTNGYIAKGALEMHGVSKTVSIPFTYTNNQFEGSFTIKRKDYNIGLESNNFSVGKEVKIEILCYIE